MPKVAAAGPERAAGNLRCNLPEFLSDGNGLRVVPRMLNDVIILNVTDHK